MKYNIPKGNFNNKILFFQQIIEECRTFLMLSSFCSSLSSAQINVLLLSIVGSKRSKIDWLIVSGMNSALANN